ncbi:MAG: hypothetical protein V3W34_04660 [Phycisphaerae bacterium]
MAKQLKRFGILVFLIAAVGVVVVVPLARSYQSGPPLLGDPAIAQAVRDVVGFGPMDVLPALAQDANHRQMITHARAFVAEHETELTPLVENVQQTRKALSHAITWGQDTTQARQAVDEARSAISQAIGNMLPGMSDQVPSQHQALVSRVLANGQLDPDLRCLDLSSGQRAAILAAQNERDKVLHNARNWHQKAKNEAAKADFEAAVHAILAETQRTRLAALRQTLRTRRMEMLLAETEPFNGG